MKLRKSVLIGTVVVAAMAFFGNAQQTPSVDTLQTQTKIEGQMTIAVTPLSLFAGQKMRFSVSLDTHSGDLSEDITTIFVLLDDNGREIAPASWTGDPPGGHHRKGELVFPARSSLPRVLTLRIQSNTIGAQEFRWNL